MARNWPVTGSHFPADTMLLNPGNKATQLEWFPKVSGWSTMEPLYKGQLEISEYGPVVLSRGKRVQRLSLEIYLYCGCCISTDDG